MSTVTKFTFDLDFDAPEEPEAEVEEVEEEVEPEIEVPTFSEEEVEQARSEGFEEGKEVGRKEAADATEQRLLEAVEKACAQLADVYNAQADANHEIAREMITISTAIAKKMFPDLNARNALGEVERVVQETLKAITDEPRVQIMVNPDLRELLTESLATMTHRAGFEGKVFVNPDPSLSLGDCRVEWSNGAAIRDSEALWEEIDQIVEQNLHGEDLIEPVEDDQHNTLEESDAEQDSDPNIEPNPETETEQEAVTEPENANHEGTPDDNQTEGADESIAETPQDMPPPEPVEAVDGESADESEQVLDEIDETESAMFAPSAAMDDTPEISEENVLDQDDSDFSEGAAFADQTPSQEVNDGDSENESDETPASAPINDPDPVSPETAAAIISVQSDSDTDEEPNPSGG